MKNNKEKMDANKKIARIVGALFITATVAGILSVVFLTPILDTPDASYFQTLCH